MDDAARMTVTSLFTGVLLIAIGILMLWLARRSRDGRLPRNRIAGVRTALTLSSDAAWFAGQRAAAGRTAIAGWGVIVGAVAILAVAVTSPPFPAAGVIFSVLALGSAAWLIAWALAGAAAAQRAAREAAERR